MAGYTPIRVEIQGRAQLSTLFARVHASKADDAELPAQRTLFAVNVPHGASAEALRTAFERLGAVSDVRLGSMEATDGSAAGASSSTAAVPTAHVIFESAPALKAALKSKKVLRLALEANAPARTESREELQRSVDSLLKRFEHEERERERQALAEKGQMDADGFVVVGRRGKPVGQEAQQQPTASADKKKRKAGANPDFYHFQQHERKREQLVKLREQFEADKARIAKMRTERKFKPY